LNIAAGQTELLVGSSQPISDLRQVFKLPYSRTRPFRVQTCTSVWGTCIFQMYYLWFCISYWSWSSFLAVTNPLLINLISNKGLQCTATHLHINKIYTLRQWAV